MYPPPEHIPESQRLRLTRAELAKFNGGSPEPCSQIASTPFLFIPLLGAHVLFVGIMFVCGRAGPPAHLHLSVCLFVFCLLLVCFFSTRTAFQACVLFSRNLQISHPLSFWFLNYNDKRLNSKCLSRKPETKKTHPTLSSLRFGLGKSNSLFVINQTPYCVFVSLSFVLFGWMPTGKPTFAQNLRPKPSSTALPPSLPSARHPRPADLHRRSRPHLRRELPPRPVRRRRGRLPSPGRPGCQPGARHHAAPGGGTPATGDARHRPLRFGLTLWFFC